MQRENPGARSQNKEEEGIDLSLLTSAFWLLTSGS